MSILLNFYVILSFVELLNAATSQLFSAPILLTYPGMTNAGVSGTMVYDFSQQTIAFQYPSLSFTEIYKFNTNLGYASSDRYSEQYVWKIAPYSACTPCAQYGNEYGFPLTNTTAWNVPSAINGRIGANTVGSVGSDGCTKYTTPSGSNSWASYFSIKNGELCSIADQNQRLWTVTGAISFSYDTSILTPPDNCKCLQPIDIAISLDRSTSISVESTYFYNAFVRDLANSFYFNSSDPTKTAQLSITQWATKFWPLNSIGNLNFTTNPNNVQTAASVIGCTSTTGDCKFCYRCNSRKKRDGEGVEYEGSVEHSLSVENSEDVQNEYNHRGPPPTRYPTRAPTTRSPTRAPTPPTAAPPVAPCSTVAPSSNSSSCVRGETTCTACGVWGVTDQFIRENTSYIYRSNAKRISIVITDGNANTAYPGTGGYGSCAIDSYQTSNPIGCYTDIRRERDYLLSQVPGIITYAIGVGDISTTTLDEISGDPSRSFTESSFDNLLTNIQKYILGFCPLPDPVNECGSCCGFCECGVCVPPDTPIPTEFCDEYEVIGPNAGGCYGLELKTNPPCADQPCSTVTCNSATNTCAYNDTCSYGGANPCFNYACALVTPPSFYSCVPKDYICGGNTASPTSAPVSSPVAPPPCGPGCGANGNCNVDGVTCTCINNYTGVLCGVPPNVDECVNDAQCFINLCINSACVVGANGGKICVNTEVNCDDSDVCTIDGCEPDIGCYNDPVVCDDGLMCTDDSCDSVTGDCVFAVADCSSIEDACHNSFCDDFAPSPGERCVLEAITCPREGNCSISECRLETGGCVNDEYTCGVAYFGAIAGIAVGVVVGATLGAAAFLCIAAAVGGGAAAVSQNLGSDTDGVVHQSPLYKAGTKSGQTAC